MKRLIFLTLSTLGDSLFAQLPDYVPSADVIAWYEFDGDWNSATQFHLGQVTVLYLVPIDSK